MFKLYFYSIYYIMLITLLARAILIDVYIMYMSMVVPVQCDMRYTPDLLCISVG